MIKAIAYYRVSAQSQADKGTIETQKTAVREFADKNGISIVDEISDEAKGGDMKRKNFDRAIRRAWSKNDQLSLIVW